MEIIVSAIGQGLIWATLGVGLFLSFRILNFPDMTVEGTFPLGAAVSVTLITMGMNPLLAALIAAFAGGIAGLVTGLLYTKGKIPILLAGILTMTAIYSINLRIMGQANKSLLGMTTLFNAKWLDFLPTNFPTVLVGLILITLITGGMALFLQTELGQAFIATGDNPAMARSMGINSDAMTTMGLIISNALIAFGGALVAQNNGFADVNMGIGIIVVALASIIIGEVAFSEQMTLGERLMTIVIGSILYRFVLVAVLYAGFNANDLNLFSAVILGLALLLPQLKQKIQLSKVLKNGVAQHGK
ncbi:ABC transporter permease [Weissella diestrammenae]|uniref:ABC transporter permease n=1 Tax=Weissella diestrammenae TaxID=1162633 RepID=A0A7G9T475_9LACO|nr:ABC transporter permease [Weissella diestrammenae]MCM0583426.1 ABC transporter permease [Weissella diestrammenae]QNN74900.1 ABC transporter permease [Weissella diestrammenae]